MSADELRQPLIRYLLGLGLRREEADDVAQESLFLLHRHPPNDNPRGWLFRVAHNRARNRQQSYESRFGKPLEGVDAESPDTPERSLLAKEKAERLGTALRNLPERERHALQLRSEGRRYREIGEALGLPVSSVADLIDRAIRKLAGELR